MWVFQLLSLLQNAADYSIDMRLPAVKLAPESVAGASRMLIENER
jgi:hypothetical protein